MKLLKIIVRNYKVQVSLIWLLVLFIGARVFVNTRFKVDKLSGRALPPVPSSALAARLLLFFFFIVIVTRVVAIVGQT